MFNTLDQTSVNFYLGTWSGSGNSTNIIWFDDVTIEPAGFVNPLRRPNMIPTVTSTNGKTVYVEGRDYSKIGFDSPSSAPNGSAIWQTPQTVTVPTSNPKCTLHEGDVVNVSFCHNVSVSDGQQTVCLAEPAIFDMITNQLQHIHADLNPEGYFMGHDEIRMGGWDGACEHTLKTPGEILADNLRRCTSIVNKAQPPVMAGAFRTPLIYAWSDMFDPNHNAKPTGRYYYCKGDGPWKNSWNGLSSNTIIMNWMGGNTNTLNWFAGNPITVNSQVMQLPVACKQILAGYYDSAVSGIDTWLQTGLTITSPDGSKSVIGVMYTTWSQNYADLAAFSTEVQKYCALPPRLP
jgi:hypothetical protein